MMRALARLTSSYLSTSPRSEGMRKLGWTALAASAALVVGVGFVHAQEELPLMEEVDGYPTDFHRGEEASFAVFHKAEQGWHIVVTSAGRRHHFKGRVWIVNGDGKFGKIEQWKGEGERRHGEPGAVAREREAPRGRTSAGGRDREDPR